jgi:hypothetical protein
VADTRLNTTAVRAIERKGRSLFAAGGVGTGGHRSTDLGASWTLLATNAGLPNASYRGFASDDFSSSSERPVARRPLIWKKNQVPTRGLFRFSRWIQTPKWRIHP